MSTWLSELKRKNPALAADYALAGNQDTQSLRNMIRALELPVSQFLNTPVDNARLAAAKRILKARKP